jgi:hypothetical protein
MAKYECWLAQLDLWSNIMQIIIESKLIMLAGSANCCPQ